MPVENLDPLEILSLVEGEVLGARVSGARISGERARQLLDRIRKNPVDRARYENLRVSVTALHGLPHLDAPPSVWDSLEARFEEALAAGRSAGRPRGRVARLWKHAVAAACLLGMVIAGAWALNGFGRSGVTGPGNVLFVERTGLPARVPPGLIVDEFLTKVIQRYQGVSPEALQALLDKPLDGRRK